MDKMNEEKVSKSVFVISTSWDYDCSDSSDYEIYATTDIPSLVKPLIEMAIEEEKETLEALKDYLDECPEDGEIKYEEDEDCFELLIKDNFGWFEIRVTKKPLLTKADIVA